MSATEFRRALVLAAGRGSRMGPLTDNGPKCLSPIAGQPILAWTQRALRANGIDDIRAVAGWKHPRLDGWFDQIRINERWSDTNMVRSLLCASDWMRQAPTLVVYGDGAYGQRAVAAALAGPARRLVVPVDRQWQSLWARRFKNPLRDAETLTMNGNRLTSIGQRPECIEDVQGQFMGLLRVTPEIWDWISDWLHRYESIHGAGALDRLDMTGMLQGLIGDQFPVYCTDVNGGWVEIDSADDCGVVESALLEPDFAHDFRY